MRSERRRQAKRTHESCAITATDNADGTFAFALQLTRAGRYAWRVWVNGLAAAPAAQLRVCAAAVCASRCSLSGEAARRDIGVNQWLTLDVTLRDRFGNHRDGTASQASCGAL